MRVEKPEHIHLPAIALSLWNAAASGLDADTILRLAQYSKYDVPGNIQADVRDYVSRFRSGSSCRRAPDGGLLLAQGPLLMLEVSRQRKVGQFITGQIDERKLQVNPAMRGHIKKALVDVGFPAEGWRVMSMAPD